MIEWISDPSLAPELARMFSRNVDARYVSHGEVMEGLASPDGRWVDDLERRIEGELRESMCQDDGSHVAVLRHDGHIVGLAIVEVVGEGAARHGILHDLVVEGAHRGRGAGEAMVAWIAEQAAGMACRRLFLESGRNNHSAHRFFERQGFEPLSTVFIREL